jgi:hypothetical protein
MSRIVMLTWIQVAAMRLLRGCVDKMNNPLQGKLDGDSTG